MSKVMIIEDDIELGGLVKSYLEKQSYEAMHITDPIEGLMKLENYDPSIIILDVMLPGIDGFETLKRIRDKFNVPVIMLTARGDIEDKLKGLDLGADDYLPKPFDPRELNARISAILRRNTVSDEKLDDFEFNGLKVNFNSFDVILDNKNLSLTTAEFELLSMFIENRGKVLSRDDIMNNLQGIDSNVFSRSIDINVSRLRQKLGDQSKEARFIKTIWGKGYMFLGEA
ncbi:MAG: response regulator transcription factor [Bacteriovoracaceae bacterium]|jgi:DNA-binding response OmpR family regulator|nr:response regulator transcription factor [Bacteriovoracaceae bacterium]